jgi:hypothetical protein
LSFPPSSLSFPKKAGIQEAKRKNPGSRFHGDDREEDGDDIGEKITFYKGMDNLG